MQHKLATVIIAISLTSIAMPAHAQNPGSFSVGAVVWRHSTNLDVTRATDFDGSDETFAESLKDWDVLGSGLGVRLSYAFPRTLSIYGEVGATQATVRDRDLLDPQQDVTSRGLNEGIHLGLGMRFDGDLAEDGNMFWSGGLAVKSVSTQVEEGVFREWDYDMTSLSLDGELGTTFRSIGFYAGLQLMQSNGDLVETDRTNLPGFQVRSVELERRAGVDVLLGARTRGAAVGGFAEVGFVGSFSAAAGLAMSY